MNIFISIAFSAKAVARAPDQSALTRRLAIYSLTPNSSVLLAFFIVDSLRNYRTLNRGGTKSRRPGTDPPGILSRKIVRELN